MKALRAVSALVLINGLLSATAYGKLTVIYDSGNTLPVDPYIKGHRIQKRSVQKMPNIKPFEFTLYPITTANMRPGEVKPRVLDMPPLFQPMFIIGSDELSMKWLSMQQERLQKLGAVGILAEADSAEDVKRIRQAFPGLVITPMSAYTIADKVGVKHYPVLITRDGIAQ